MKKKIINKTKAILKDKIFLVIFIVFLLVFIIFCAGDLFGFGKLSYAKGKNVIETLKDIVSPPPPPKYMPLNIADYDARMKILANNPIPKAIPPKIDATEPSTA